jgi:ribosomal protein S18 acetylase RimI-like enzyme
MKAFRLESLQLDPEAFASTYADEVRFADEVWDKRMANPLALHFVAVEVPSGKETPVDGITAMVGNDWLGMLVVIGPKEDGTGGLHASRSPWDSMNSEASDADGAAEKSKPLPMYQLNGVFVMPKARGLGVGKRLAMATIDESLESARDHGFKAIRMQVRVEADNEPAKKLYSSAGFAEVGTETYMTKEKEKNRVKIPPKTGTCTVMERLEEVN